jgi:hypothetical protein
LEIQFVPNSTFNEVSSCFGRLYNFDNFPKDVAVCVSVLRQNIVEILQIKNLIA